MQRRATTISQVAKRERGQNKVQVFDYKPHHMVLVVIGVIPFFIWRFYSHSIWPEFFAAAYLLTGVFALSVLIGYPGPDSRWFWKPVSLLCLLHCVFLAAFTFGAFTIDVTGIKPPTAMLFSLVITTMGVESVVWIRLMNKFLSRYGVSAKRRDPHRTRILHEK